MIRKLASERILIENRPAHATHATYGYKVSLPGIQTSKALLEAVLELAGHVAFPLGSHVAKIVLVENHTPVLEAEVAFYFRISGICCRSFFLLRHFQQLFAEKVRVFNISLVQPEVHLQRLVRNAT